MVPLDEASEALPDAVDSVEADDSELHAGEHRLDRNVNIVLAVVVAAVVLLGGYFGYSIWAQQQFDALASPAQKVINEAQKLVNKSPNDQTLRVRLAEALAAAGRLEQARSELLAAIQIDKKYIGGYQALASVELLMKDYNNAEKHLNEILKLTEKTDYKELNDRREFAYFSLGEISLLRQDYTEAVGYFNAAIRIRRDASDSYLRLAQAYAGLEYWDKAKEQLDICLAFDPKFPQAHYEKGKILLAQGDKVNAAWEFRASLDGAPDQAEPKDALRSLGTYSEWFEKADKAYQAKNLKDALDAVRIARAMEPSSYEAAFLNGRIMDAQGDFSGAADAYSAALNAQPKDAAAKAAFDKSVEASNTKAAQ